jgi:hypothetical protein
VYAYIHEAAESGRKFGAKYCLFKMVGMKGRDEKSGDHLGADWFMVASLDALIRYL